MALGGSNNTEFLLFISACLSRGPWTYLKQEMARETDVFSPVMEYPHGRTVWPLLTVALAACISGFNYYIMQLLPNQLADCKHLL